MRNKLVLAVVIAIVALGMVPWAKSGVLSAPTAAVSFGDRWMPVDEALHTGKFAVKN